MRGRSRSGYSVPLILNTLGSTRSLLFAKRARNHPRLPRAFGSRRGRTYRSHAQTLRDRRSCRFHLRPPRAGCRVYGDLDGQHGRWLLRQAITDANGAAGADVINFNIQGTGVQVIALSSALPVITGPVTIDGYLQQPGASANTLSSGNNAVIRVELRGGGTGSTSGASGLAITAGNSVVRGLAINGFPGRGIDLSGSGNNRIEGCFIGTDAAGTAPLGNRVGVAVNGPGNIIGGTTPAARNVISASSNPFGDFNSHGISITGGSGNLITIPAVPPKEP